MCVTAESTKWLLLMVLFSLSFFSLLSGLFTYSPRRGYCRVMKFCRGPNYPKIRIPLKRKSGTLSPPLPLALRAFGAENREIWKHCPRPYVQNCDQACADGWCKQKFWKQRFHILIAIQELKKKKYMETWETSWNLDREREEKSISLPLGLGRDD